MKTQTALLAGLALLLLNSVSYATLGEHVNSVDTDIHALRASQKASSSTDKYTIHEMTADGNTIKEYATSDGTVFAVSWRGISKPDLSVLFGTYYNEYNTAVAKAPKQFGKRTASLTTSRMVVHRGGHMRDMRGFAYVPSLIPSGLNIEDLEK